MGSFEKGGGDGNNDDKKNIKPFPNKATRLGEPVGFERKGVSAPATPAGTEERPVEIELFTEDECIAIATEVDEDLTPVALGNPSWNITQETLEQKIELLLKEADGNPLHLVPYLQKASKEDVSQEKADIILHIAAARAYLDIIELRNREEIAET